MKKNEDFFANFEVSDRKIKHPTAKDCQPIRPTKQPTKQPTTRTNQSTNHTTKQPANQLTNPQHN